jgi:small subunit ribosomal protein S4e
MFKNNSIRYPDPAIKVNDTVKIDLKTGKITDFISFDTGVIAMVTGGRNMGRVGVITHRERHDGGFNIVHLKDAIDNTFATREGNVFVIGREKPWISLPKGKGVKVKNKSHSPFLLPSLSLPFSLSVFYLFFPNISTELPAFFVFFLFFSPQFFSSYFNPTSLSVGGGRILRIC